MHGVSFDPVENAVGSYYQFSKEANPDGLIALAPHIDPINDPTVNLGDRNAYDFRLIVSRKLYDRSSVTTTSPSLAQLISTTTLFVNPLDVARIGSSIGAEVKVSSVKATVVLSLDTDASVQRGTAWVPFNQFGVNIGELIDAAASVTDVRIESL